MVVPYFPDLVEEMVTNLSSSFNSRDVDPFEVRFAKGLIQQAARDVNKGWDGKPVVYLVYKYAEDFGRDAETLESIDFTLVIANPTDNKYTQQEREDLIYKPRLLPVQMAMVEQIENNQWFDFDFAGPKYTRLIAPFWMQGEVNGTDDPNMFNKYLDTIFLHFRSVTIKRFDCPPDNNYYINDTTVYPPLPGTLMFYDDIELIVDEGGQYDPISDTSSVIIDFLVGKTFEVERRGTGQLRQRKKIEIIPDTVNGGFAFADPLQTFQTGETYIIKIRPQYV